MVRVHVGRPKINYKIKQGTNMLHSDENYKIEEKEVNGRVRFHVTLGKEDKVFDSLLDAKIAIKTFKMGIEFSKHTGMEIFVEKE